jgi:type VI secretion system protein ImpC
MQFTVKMGGQARQRQTKNRASGLAVVMLGAFDGLAETGDTPHQGAPAVHPIDIDTLDIRMAKLQPSTSLSLDSVDDQSGISIRFACLDDFHPDRLLEQLTAHALSTDNSPVVIEAQRPARSPLSREGQTDAESEQDALSRLLGERPLNVEQKKTGGSKLSASRQSMIKELVQRIAENASEERDTKSPEFQTNGIHENQNTTRLLRKLLHDKSFQALEAGWRAVDWLIRSTEPDPAIRFYILNMSRRKLAHERAEHEIPTTSPLYCTLRDLQGRDDLSEFDFLLLDQHQYGLSPDDIATLEWLGSLVDNFDGTLLAGADSSFMKSDIESSDAIEAWQNFRQRTSSTSMALFYPQVLLRLPYGSQTDPVEGLDFEELDASWTIDDLLWGNPAYAALILMIRQWMDQADTDTPTLLTDLPAYSYKRDGDYRLQPCTKTLLGESEIDHLLQLGLVPLIGSASNNTIKIPWYQHLGSPSGW